eukprot:scaffold188_cov429-Prasinococcus_capsulatus_cf.AAC.8
MKYYLVMGGSWMSRSRTLADFPTLDSQPSNGRQIPTLPEASNNTFVAPNRRANDVSSEPVTLVHKT